MVDGGTVGRLQYIKGAFTFTHRREYDHLPIRESGGGRMWDIGCYPISYARMIVRGEPLRSLARRLRVPLGDESFYGRTRFGNKAHLHFDCGFKYSLRAYLEIVGTEGLIDVPNPFKPGSMNEIHIRRGDRQGVVKIKGNELYPGEVEDLCDVSPDGRPQRVSIEESRRNIAST